MTGPHLPPAQEGTGLPPLDREPEEVRRTAEEILADPAYRPPRPSYLERVLDWIGDRLDGLFGSLGGAGGGGVGNVVALLFLVAVVGVLLWLLARTDWRSLRRRRADDDPEGVLVIDEHADLTSLRRRAEDAEAAGRHRDALRWWFALLVAELVDDGFLDAIPGRTAGEYRREVDDVLPAAAGPFGDAVDRFEGAWYGNEPVDAVACAEVRRLSGEVRSAAAAMPSPHVAGVAS